MTDPAAPEPDDETDLQALVEHQARLSEVARAAFEVEPWPPEAQPDHTPDTAGKRVRYDTKGFPHLIDGEMDQPIRWTDTH